MVHKVCQCVLPPHHKKSIAMLQQFCKCEKHQQPYFVTRTSTTPWTVSCHIGNIGEAKWASANSKKCAKRMAAQEMLQHLYQTSKRKVTEQKPKAGTKAQTSGKNPSKNGQLKVVKKDDKIDHVNALKDYVKSNKFQLTLEEKITTDYKKVHCLIEISKCGNIPMVYYGCGTCFDSAKIDAAKTALTHLNMLEIKKTQCQV